MKKLQVTAAMVLAVGIGQAGAAPIISAQLLPDPTTTPFLVENFGTGGPADGDGKTSVLSGFVTSTGVTVNYSGLSGVYVGDVGGKTRSPFRNAAGNATDQRYLNARAGELGGYVELKYTSAQTAFNLLWGSIDPSPASYNTLTFQFGNGPGPWETVTGADVAATIVGESSGVSNVAVWISGLQQFDTIRVTASQEAFEFAPGVPVPEPASMFLLGSGLIGLAGAARRRGKK